MTKATAKPGPKPRKAAKPAPIADEEDDLIGSTAPAAPPTPAPTDESLGDGDGELVMAMADVYGGVSASWLAQVFGHDKNTIAKKLATAGIEVVGRRGGGPLYRIPDAAAYLVKPKVDLITYIKSLRPNDLPPMLNDAYWAAMLKRQKWEENAGDLWRTSDVLAVFGDLAIMFKTTVNLWVEEVERIDGITQEQRGTLTKQSDKLLEQVYELMVNAPGRRKTTSTIAEDGAPDDAEVQEVAE